MRTHAVHRVQVVLVGLTTIGGRTGDAVHGFTDRAGIAHRLLGLPGSRRRLVREVRFDIGGDQPGGGRPPRSEVFGGLLVAINGPRLRGDVSAVLLLLTPVGAMILGALVLVSVGPCRNCPAVASSSRVP